MSTKAESFEAPESLTHIRDARGRRVTQLDPVVLNLLRRYDAIPEETLRAIAADVGTGLNKGLRWLVILSAACVVIVTIGAVGYLIEMRRTGVGLGWFWRKITPFVGVWTGPVLFWLGAKRRRYHRICAAMLAYLRCPHCAYDLRMLPRDESDGLTVCPECGCAWRLGDTADPEAGRNA